MTIQKNTFQNELLKALSDEDLSLLLPHLEKIRLDVPTQLEKPNGTIEDVYFLESGLASIVAQLPGGRDIEVGIVGRDGMTGAAVILGDKQSTNTTFMQVSGHGFKLPSSVLRSAMEQSAALHSLVLCYIQSLLIQTASTALANGHAKLEERLARWLLMVHDRMDGLIVPLTHEFLAVMLGVRRPGVTVALHILEGKGLIRTVRGQVTILSRKGLIQQSRGSYGVAEAEYLRLFGTPLSR